MLSNTLHGLYLYCFVFFHVSACFKEIFLSPSDRDSRPCSDVDFDICCEINISRCAPKNRLLFCPCFTGFFLLNLWGKVLENTAALFFFYGATFGIGKSPDKDLGGFDL